MGITRIIQCARSCLYSISQHNYGRFPALRFGAGIAVLLFSRIGFFLQSFLIEKIHQTGTMMLLDNINDILAGATEALIKRIISLLERVGIEKDFSISGGVAKNIGVVKRLEERLGLKACLAFDPQLVGAIGAALFAKEKFTKKFLSN